MEGAVLATLIRYAEEAFRHPTDSWLRSDGELESETSIADRFYVPVA
jgi:hypothetical protein